jgi:hypothetical protein
VVRAAFARVAGRVISSAATTSAALIGITDCTQLTGTEGRLTNVSFASAPRTS